MSQAGRSVAGIDGLQHHLAVFPRDQRGFQSAYGASEVAHLLGEAIIPQLLKDRLAPTFGRGRLFDRVAEAILAVGRQRVAHLQVGNRQAALAVDLDAIIHAAAASPAVLDNAEGVAFEFDDGDCFVIELCLVTVDVGAQVRVDTQYLGPPQEPVREADAMGAQVEAGPRRRLASHPKTIPHAGRSASRFA